MAPKLKTPSVQQHHAEEREATASRLLDAARGVFARDGSKALSMRKVAKEASVAVGTLYLYFEDKEALLSAVVDDSFRVFAQEMSAAASGPQGLRGIADAYWQFGLSHPDTYRLLFVSQPPLLEEGGERTASLQLLEDAVAQAEPGLLQFYSASAIADAIWACMHGAVALAITCHTFSPARSAAMKAASVELLLRGLDLPASPSA